MNRAHRRALICEARFRAGIWLKTDVEGGAVDSVRERHPDYTEEDLLVIEHEIMRIASKLITESAP